MSDLELPGDQSRPTREGLPSSYRMRADEHYVDFLASRGTDEESPQAVPADPGRPGETERDAASSRTSQVTPQVSDVLARSVSTATSLAELLSGPLSDLSRAGVGTLLRAELFRASSLVQAARVVHGELPLMRGAVAVAALIDRVLHDFGPERRLRHVDITPHVDLPPGHIVVADERLLTAAVGASLFATFALLEGLPASRMVLVAGLTAGRQLTLVASQDHVLPTQAWAARAFDAGWTDRPGGTGVVLAMAALQQVARAHGGDAQVTLSPRGTRIGLTIPAGV
ncbi:MAG: hypothetical protein AB7H96_13860 [Vicinamibacterales bacterium]